MFEKYKDRECIWKSSREPKDLPVTYFTSCGYKYILNISNVKHRMKDSEVNYCPFCGGFIKEK